MMRAVLLALLLLRPAWGQVPVPDDVRVLPPEPGVPEAIAGFSGVWGGGAWGGVLPTGLVVERVDADGSAAVVYAVGDSRQFGIAAQWVRVAGMVREGRLVVPLRGGPVAEFAGVDGRLEGTFTAGAGWRTGVVLRRLAGDPAAALARPVVARWEEVRIAVPGEGFGLQGFWYGAAGAGRHPVVVFNHGSTDGERRGVPSIQPAETQALVFLAQGWSVLAPMRRGRGGSGGPMMEPSDQSVPEQAQVAAGVADLDAAVDWVRARGDVDPARVVVAGQSRGGMLAVTYAGRFPAKVAGAVNFAGGWWSARSGPGGFNAALAAEAGGVAVPMLWLYGARDSYYGLDVVRQVFAAFQGAGGRGTLLTFDGPRDGHGLVGYPGLWGPAVSRFLQEVAR